jgi:hypothetical protein
MGWKLILLAGVVLLSGDLFAKKVDGKTVPFHGVVSGYLLDFGEVPAGRCDDAPTGKVAWALTSFDGWGTATHLGEIYMYAEHCSYGTVVVGPDGPYVDPDGTYGEGEFYMIADNGDILAGTYTNGASLSGPPVVGFMDYVTFQDGGTGRFTFASGGGIDLGAVDFGDFSFTMQMTGVIAYKRK